MSVKHLVASGVAMWFGLTASAFAAQTVTFVIKNGNGATPWNTQATMITVKVGDTVHIVNDDTVNHRLHTDGEPCPHGPEMTPGQSYDCVVDAPFDPNDNGPLYDHDFGPDTPFWLTVTN